MQPADPRNDDTATARETTCPDCGGEGTVTTRIVSSIDPGAVREFYQTCLTCHGTGKVGAVEAMSRE